MIDILWWEQSQYCSSKVKDGLSILLLIPEKNFVESKEIDIQLPSLRGEQL